MNILVVEDSQPLRTAYHLLLEFEGHKVTSAEDGQAGFDAALSEKFDLILTDHDMPNLSGSEMASRLRAAYISTPIILCTGNPQAVCPEAASIIHKPFDSDDLLAHIGTYAIR